MTPLEGHWEQWFTPTILIGPISAVLASVVTLVLWRRYQAPFNEKLTKVQIELEARRARETHRVSVLQESRKQSVIEFWARLMESQSALNTLFSPFQPENRDLRLQMARVQDAYLNLRRAAQSIELFLQEADCKAVQEMDDTHWRAFCRAGTVVIDLCQFDESKLFREEMKAWEETRTESWAQSERCRGDLLMHFRRVLGVDQSENSAGLGPYQSPNAV
jgi:hypothetical protein